MVKRCLLVLALAATHPPASSVASGVAAPGSAAHRHHPQAEADKFQVWRTEAAASLSARADANSLATAAALRYTGPVYGTVSAYGAGPASGLTEASATP